MNKKPRFFCDNCGNEVGQNEKICRHCGRYFASVRCPSCGHIGDETSFRNGCPSCGYSAPPGKQTAEKYETRRLGPPGKLPLWVYIISVFAFVGAFAFLLYIMR